MKSITSFLICALAIGQLMAQSGQLTHEETGTYTAVVTGYDWGPAVNKVILHLDESISEANAANYQVKVERRTDCGELPEGQASGERNIFMAYVSDEDGNRKSEGKYLALVLEVKPMDPLANPIQYFFNNEKCRGNQWIDYQLIITEAKSGKQWKRSSEKKIMPLVDRFKRSGTYTHTDDVRLTYADYQPTDNGAKRPLLIWLHGGGEGGTDPAIALLANRAANYASDEIQAYFDGAYVLVPQTPGAWMHNQEGVSTRGKEEDIYHPALMGLIRKYVADHPGIDADRIYVGGCSNGGYMSLKLILMYPDYFAAAYISALAYRSEYITDEQLAKIKDVPVWLIHSKDDPVTLADRTAVPLYHRLKKMAAPVHFSYYDHVVDLTGLFGGDDFHYNGHFSWIYSHVNHCRTDFDGSLVRLEGRPVSLMEWMAAQRRGE